jgi:cell division protein ZapA
MGMVQVSIDGKAYRMACADGQEGHLQQLAELLDGKIGEMRLAFGEIGDMRLTVMAAITIADQLAETDVRIGALEAEVASLRAGMARLESEAKASEEAAAAALDGMAARLRALSRSLAGG